MNDGHNGDLPPEEIDTGEPITALARLDHPVGESFLGRLLGRIERRTMGNELVSLGWRAPILILFEFLAMIFEFLGFAKDPEGGSS